METLFGSPLETGTLALLLVSLAIAFGFEFVNGFHDTANAVATVIYTKSLRPWTAVVWSGICNFSGVFLGGISVAMGIIYLLPVELLVSKGTGSGLAMVMALLTAAIVWNLGTWYLGLPASSSHTMIGAILGVGLAQSALPGHTFGDGVNWGKVSETGLALLVSPLIGFTLAGMLLWLSKRLIRDPKLYSRPDPDKPPPLWIRAILVVTCTGVSFAHGSNDGQKGIGLVMLILIGIVPTSFALNLAVNSDQINRALQATQQIEANVRRNAAQSPVPVAYESNQSGALKNGLSVAEKIQLVSQELAEIRAMLSGKASLRDVPKEQRWEIRARIIEVDGALKSLQKGGFLNPSKEEAESLKKHVSALRGLTDFAPTWVKVAIAFALGVGTMIGWKRIVVTVGEKIGKDHLTYGQGASAELVAMSTIGLASVSGLPVSTTHVLSSGVAGTMVAQGSGLQMATITKIASAWVLTLPASMLLSGCLFLLLRLVFV
jgi:phosphate/sulfate permease